MDVIDVRKHCDDIVLIAMCFNMAAKQSYSCWSLKVLQELVNGASQKDLAQKYAMPRNNHINMKEEQE